jgi:uncharacterized protein (DUF1800 family)
LIRRRTAAEWTSEIGQDLFFPPNVGGWPGGRRWLSPQTLIGRTNYAVAARLHPAVEQPSPP